MAEPTSTPHSRDFELVRQAIGPDPGRPPYPETSLGHLATEAINRIEEQLQTLEANEKELEAAREALTEATLILRHDDDVSGRYEKRRRAYLDSDIARAALSNPASEPQS